MSSDNPALNGPEIRRWRESKDLSRKDLASLCDVEASTVANWELDRNKPHGAAKSKLEKLMAGEESVNPLTRQEERLLDELVRQGGFATRAEYLAHALIQRITTEEASPLPRSSKRGAGGK